MKARELERVEEVGKVEIPSVFWKKIGVDKGDQVVLKVKDRKIVIQPKLQIVNRLYGSIKLKNPKAVKELVKSEDWLV